MNAERGLKRMPSGSGHRYTLDGKPVLGVTTVLGDGYPKPALVGWAANATAAYAHDHWDELADLPPSQRLKQMERGRFIDLKRTGDVGTRVHAFVMRQALGFREAPDEDIAPYIDSYEAFVRDWDPRELVAEAVVGSRAFGYAGTLDTIATLADGHTWLLDFKTGRTGPWPDHAVQLSAYAHAEFYVDRAGVEQPLPTIDRVAVVRLLHDDYSLHPVDAGDEAFEVFLFAQGVARWCARNIGEVIGERQSPPTKAVAT